MRTRTKLLIAFLFALLVSASIWLALREREPSYEGRPLSYWVTVYHRPATLADRAAAENALHHIGPAAIPFLLQWIEHESRVGRLERVVPFLAAFTGNRARRLQLANSSPFALSPLGTNVLRFVPHLFARAASRGRTAGQQRAITSLVLIRPLPVPELLTLITNTDSQTAIMVVSDLHYAGTNALPLIPTVLTTLRSKHQGLAAASAETLGILGLQPSVVLPELAVAACSSDETVRGLAVWAIKWNCSTDAPIVPLLNKQCDAPGSVTPDQMLEAASRTTPRHYLHP